MGVSACEILRIVIRMCLVAGDWDNLSTETPAITAYEGAKSLQTMYDDSIANEFLQAFVTLRQQEVSNFYSGVLTGKSPSWKLHISPEDPEFMTGEFTSTFAIFKLAKASIFYPSTMNGTTKTPWKFHISSQDSHWEKIEVIPQYGSLGLDQHSVTGLWNVSKGLPPIAPSLQSSEQYSSFRALAIRIKRRSRNQKSGSRKSSNSIQTTSERQYSVEDIRPLCESFSSSLDLSSSLPDPWSIPAPPVEEEY